jgi:hypothetical protein
LYDLLLRDRGLRNLIGLDLLRPRRQLGSALEGRSRIGFQFNDHGRVAGRFSLGTIRLKTDNGHDMKRNHEEEAASPQQQVGSKRRR